MPDKVFLAGILDAEVTHRSPVLNLTGIREEFCNAFDYSDVILKSVCTLDWGVASIVIKKPAEDH